MPLIILGAIIVGLTLGMLGSGGSAVTVPVLIYLVGHGTKEAIAESMAIVGLISIAAAVPYARSRQIDWQTAFFFGLPGVLGTLLGAWLGGISSDALQLVVFGIVLLLAAGVMIFQPHSAESHIQDSHNDRRNLVVLKIGIEGMAVGIVTGFVGVGGGFLIVPALVLLGKLPMRRAIGTSLVIIAAKAALGFAKYEQHLLDNNLTVDFGTVLAFVVLGIFGSAVGRSINLRMNQQALQRAFASFLILLGGFVIVNEGSKLIASIAAEQPAGQIRSTQQTMDLMAQVTEKSHVSQILL